MSTTTILLFIENVTSTHLWLVFAILLIYTFFMSWILLYHWHYFGTNEKAINLAKKVYISVTAFLIFLLIAIIFSTYAYA